MGCDESGAKGAGAADAEGAVTVVHVMTGAKDKGVGGARRGGPAPKRSWTDSFFLSSDVETIAGRAWTRVACA